MAYTNDAKNAMLNALGALITHAALYSDNAGTIEVTGGDPAYARQAVTWAAASESSKAASNQPEFSVFGTHVRSVGLVSAATGGTKYIHENVTNEEFIGQGLYLLTSIVMRLN